MDNRLKKELKRLRCNPQGNYPQIDQSVYVDPLATVIGNVIIGKNAFVGPGAVIRADEPGSSINIHDNCNIQDNVVIHSLSETNVEIDESTSLAHSCVVHGPCKIGKRCFIGFGSIVFNSTLGNDVVVKHRVVIEGVTVPPERIIRNGVVVDSDKRVFGLKPISDKARQFSREVIKANQALVKNYKK